MEGAGGARHGRYTDPGCTTKSQSRAGEYEWTPGFARAAFKTAAGRSTIETVGKSQIACKREAASGRYTGPKAQTIEITFTGCENAAKAPCQNEGLPAGEVKFLPLAARLAFITNKPTSVSVGWRLEPAEHARYLAMFECGTTSSAARVLVEGSVIVPVTPLDAMYATESLRYSAVGGLQRPQRFEGGARNVLFTSIAPAASEQSGLTSVQALTNEEPLEVKALP